QRAWDWGTLSELSGVRQRQDSLLLQGVPEWTVFQASTWPSASTSEGSWRGTSRKLLARYSTSAPSGKRMLFSIMQTGLWLRNSQLLAWTTRLPVGGCRPLDP
ncbi:hypothetical protein LEMLEM_LOCUS21175, partial [Lemmus lemmus]